MKVELDISDEMGKDFQSFADWYTNGDLTLALNLLLKLTQFNILICNLLEKVTEIETKVKKLEETPKEKGVKTFGGKYG